MYVYKFFCMCISCEQQTTFFVHLPKIFRDYKFLLIINISNSNFIIYFTKYISYVCVCT